MALVVVIFIFFFFFFKQKTAYEIYQCDWSSDVCSSDLGMPCIPLIIMPDDLLIFHGTIPFTIHGIMDRTLMIPGTIIHLIMAMDIGVVAILILIMVQDIIIPAGGAGMAEADTRNHNRRKNHVIGSVVIPTISQADRKSTRLNSSHTDISRMPSSA